MSRPILSTILIIIAVITFFSFINPTYKETKVLGAKNSQFDEALERSKELQSVRDTLLSKYNTFSSENLKKIEKMLPDNVDNVRLILDIDGIASQYGMAIRNLSLSSDSDKSSEANSQNVGEVVISQSKLGEIDLGFSVTTNYDDFQKFIKDLEQSLRIVDIKNLDIKPQSGGSQLDFTINMKTYWLK